MCKLIPAIRNLPYREQLSSLGLLSLKARRLRYQLIFIFKLSRGLLSVNFSGFFELADARITRGHNRRIRTKFSSHNYRLNFFTVSAIAMWNQLSQEDVDVQSLAAFKLRLASFFSSIDMW